ncbi:MAG: hypothetical protein GY803_23695, partial [Chloroflexi bacterium]|nr:hypothetical protein [Chloroflexota bacterium]
LPQWLAPPRNSYAIGGEYVVMLGTHLFVEELIIANEGPQSVYSVVVPDLLGDVPYQYGLHKETTLRGAAAPTLPISSDWNPDGSQLFITQYFEDGLQTVHMGGFRPAAGGQPIASFGAYTLWEATGWLCAGAATTNLVWQQSEPASPTTSIFVQLLAEDGRLIAQADGPPLGLRPDLLQLAPGWEMTDRRTLEPTESGAPAQLLVGAYDFASGERAPAFDNQQVALPDNALRIPITPCLE